MRVLERVCLAAVSIALPVVAFAAIPEVAQEKVEVCLKLDSTAARNACYDKLCTFSTSCARALVTKATEFQGPKTGFVVLKDLMAREDRTVTSDGHDLAHQV